MGQPSDRNKRAELESLHAQALRLQARVAELDETILRSWGEAADAREHTLDLRRGLENQRAQARVLRARLKLNDWTPAVAVLVICALGALGLLIVLGSAR